MEKLWKSCLYHVLNIHSWEENGIEYKCNHGELQLDKDQPRKWLSKQSESFHELEKIVCDAQMIKDLKHLNLFCHTGKLEVFHSFVLKYRPKRIHFKMDAMEARTKLAALANNRNSHRVQAKVMHPTPNSASYGDLKYLSYFPKSKKQWMVRPVYEDMDLSYIFEMNIEVLDLIEGKSTHSWESRNVQLPPNIASTPKPEKKLLIQKHQSRF
ncbi:uncharacterized protein LOC128653648 [Bombina bombina]|uniref:uncharacterized protein LOC128653648 n=1 Tax=Bombina bombina TaxID=8345 RepID=UPI00235ADC4E|nr:uncharacterized protein LOC128653648 [Bombina bombina]